MATVDPERIKQARKVDLLALARQHTTFRRYGRHVMGRCPLHHGDGANFGVYRDEQGNWSYYCYSQCGYGDVINFMMELEGVSFKAAVTRLLGTDPSSLPRSTVPIARPVQDWRHLPPLDRAARKFHFERGQITSAGLTAQEWWQRRGISNRAIQRFLLGYCRACPTFKDDARPGYRPDTATIPILQPDAAGQLVTAQIRHRTIPNEPNKYWPHRVGTGTFLFNRHSLERDPDGEPRTDRETVLAFAGEAKVIATADRGVDDIWPCVAPTSGERSWLSREAYVEDWYNAMVDYERVVFIADPDLAGVAAAETAARKVFGRRGYVALLPGKIDDLLAWDELQTLNALVRVVSTATPVVERSYHIFT